MSKSDSEEKLPETIEDQQFLLDLPEDLVGPCVHIQNLVGRRLIAGDLIGGEMVAAVKQALHLPLDPVDMGATRVILNATKEAIELVGFASPEVVLQQLKERKRKLLETLGTK